jgi:hypothetical protein
MIKERELLKNILQVKKRVARIISIPPEEFKHKVYLENVNYVLVKEETELYTDIKEVVQSYNAINLSMTADLVNTVKKLIIKTFKMFEIEVIEDENEFDALVDEELDEDAETGDLADTFTKTRLARSMLLTVLVIMTLLFREKKRMAGYAFFMYVVIWYMIRLLEHQLFDKSMLPTVKEILPWFSVLLTISVMQKKTVIESFKFVVSALNEHSKVFTLILGIQVAQVVVRFSSWSKMMGMIGVTKEPEDEINPKDIKDFS